MRPASPLHLNSVRTFWTTRRTARSEWSMALRAAPKARVRFLLPQTLLPLFSASAAKRRARRRSERRAKRAFRESAKVCKPRFGSTNQRGRREAASAWRVKAERSEAFTRQQGLQAVVTSATFLGEKGQEGEKEEGKEYEME